MEYNSLQILCASIYQSNAKSKPKSKIQLSQLYNHIRNRYLQGVFATQNYLALPLTWPKELPAHPIKHLV